MPRSYRSPRSSRKKKTRPYRMSVNTVRKELFPDEKKRSPNKSRASSRSTNRKARGLLAMLEEMIDKGN
jgi:hypothetical protein